MSKRKTTAIRRRQPKTIEYFFRQLRLLEIKATEMERRLKREQGSRCFRGVSGSRDCDSSTGRRHQQRDQDASAGAVMARGTGSTPMMDITAKLRRIINTRADMARPMDIEAGRRKSRRSRLVSDG